MGKGKGKAKLSGKELDIIAGGLSFAEMAIRAVTQGISAEYGLAPRGAWILMLIAKNQVLYPSDLRNYFDISNSVITEELSRLTKARLISYRSSSDDRRRVELGATPSGAEIGRRTEKAYRDLLTSQFAPYSREELLLLSRMVQDFIPGKVAIRWARFPNPVPVVTPRKKARKPRGDA